MTKQRMPDRALKEASPIIPIHPLDGGQSLGRRLALVIVALLITSCRAGDAFFLSPPPTPVPRHLASAHRVHVPLVYGPLPVGEVWRAWPRHKFGVAAGALFIGGRAAVEVARWLPVYGAANWDVSYQHAQWAAEAGIVYFPRLSMKVTFNPPGAPDLDGVTGEHADLLSCEPLRGQEAEVKRVAQAFPGMAWDLFNEPDNLDLTSGVGCWDETVGGPGYTGFGGDPHMTGPRHAYRQAAAVVRAWVQFVRQYDPAARFTCCGELNGPSAAYVRGVADAYRELYGERVPLDAVSLHIYQVDSWDLEAYRALLRTAIANVDAHPDLRGLPLVLNEGILLTKALDATSRERSAWLLYHWMDWLALQDRVVFMAWWVDGLCSIHPGENPDHEFCRRQYELTSGTTAWPGTRLFDDKRLDRRMYSPSGEVWRRYWCNWTDRKLQPVPAPCPVLGEGLP